MLRSRFLWKLYAGYAFIILLSSLLVGSLVAKRVEAQTLKETDRKLSAITFVVRDLVKAYFLEPETREPKLEELQQRIVRLGQETEVRLTVTRADGVVIADSDKNPRHMENHSSRPEIIEAYEEGVGRSTRFSKSIGKVLRYLAVPLVEEGRDVAVVRASLPLLIMEDRLRDLRRAVFLGAMLTTLAALFLGFLYARRVTRPILSMAHAASEIAGGDYEQRVETPGRDELGTLARAFNTMTRELRSSVMTMESDHNKLTAILSSMVEGVVAVDRDERIMHINQVASQLLKVESAVVVGRPIWEISRLHEVSEILGEVLAEASNSHRVIRMSGSPERVVELRASPLVAESGLAGAVLILEDVTQLRHLETMRRDFIGNVSHELKTPVTAIRGMIETLIDSGDDDSALRERFLPRVLVQADRMGDLVTDLLSLAHIESAEALSDTETLDVRDSVREAIRSLQPAIESHPVTVELDLPEESVPAIGTEEFLTQAVANLINNAIKYSPEEGRVEVRLRSEETRSVIEVRDHGAGIEACHQERLFERFYRVDKARSRRLGGTGLGLAIVKHIALSMGGKVSVDSVPGQGSTFRLDLPLWRPATGPPPEA